VKIVDLYNLPNIDKWITNVPDDDVYGVCKHCNGDVYWYEPIYRSSEGYILHNHCFEQFAMKELSLYKEDAGEWE
jgi:hypothetical protein